MENKEEVREAISRMNSPTKQITDVRATYFTIDQILQELEFEPVI